MASVSTRVNKDSTSYRVRWVDVGTGERLSETFASRAEAERLAEMIEHAGGRTPRDWVLGVGLVASTSQAVTLDEAFETYLEAHETRTAPYTRRRYRRDWAAQFGSRWPGWRVDELTVDEVQRWVNEAARTRSAKTVRNHHGMLAGVLKHAVGRGLGIAANPCDHVLLPARVKRPAEHGHLSAAQVATIATCAKPDVRDFIALAAWSGLRWGELAALTGPDVVVDELGTWLRVSKAFSIQDSEDGRLRQVLGRPKTDAAMRDALIDPAYAPAVQRLAERAGRGFLFTAPRGGPLRYSTFHEDRWKPALRGRPAGRQRPASPGARDLDPSIPVDTTFHHIRHSYAWWQMAQGVDLAALRLQMGHTTIEMTATVYGGLTRAARALALTRAGEAPRELTAAQEEFLVEVIEEGV